MHKYYVNDINLKIISMLIKKIYFRKLCADVKAIIHHTVISHEYDEEC